MFIHHHPTIWAMMRTQTHRFLDREIGVVRGDVGTPMYGRLCLSCILWGNNTELEVCVWIYIFYMIVYTLVINSLCDTNTTCFLFFLCVHIHMCIYMYNTRHMDLCCQSDPYRQCWQFVTWIKTGVPSGKRLHNYGKIHHCSWEIPLFRLGHFQ